MENVCEHNILRNSNASVNWLKLSTGYSKCEKRLCQHSSSFQFTEFRVPSEFAVACQTIQLFDTILHPHIFISENYFSSFYLTARLPASHVRKFLGSHLSAANRLPVCHATSHMAIYINKVLFPQINEIIVMSAHVRDFFAAG